MNIWWGPYGPRKGRVYEYGPYMSVLAVSAPLVQSVLGVHCISYIVRRLLLSIIVEVSDQGF